MRPGPDAITTTTTTIIIITHTLLYLFHCYSSLRVFTRYRDDLVEATSGHLNRSVGQPRSVALYASIPPTTARLWVFRARNEGIILITRVNVVHGTKRAYNTTINDRGERVVTRPRDLATSIDRSIGSITRRARAARGRRRHFSARQPRAKHFTLFASSFSHR
jgi:hypothetical protein